MDPTSLERAVIINMDFKRTKGVEKIECRFNPKEYSIQKQNAWTMPKVTGKSAPALQFDKGQPATLTLQLFFDTYSLAKNGEKPVDVRVKYTGPLWTLMQTDKNLLVNNKTKAARPPHVQFHWGNYFSFTAVITSMTQKYTLFLPDGTPVRATVDLSLQQLQDESILPSQNPTSAGEGGERLWTVREGDTLATLAYQHLGDPAAWRQIADANRHRLRPQDLRHLPVGTRLILPPG